MKYSPAYRAAVYAPRSIDATETTVLTPRAGAPHAEPFLVATVQLAGYKPVLQLPIGARGRIDPITCKRDIGSLSLELLDQRTLMGGSNAQRWVTAFVGDAEGLPQLAGCKVYVEQALDWNPATQIGTWTPFFTGRILKPSQSGRLRITLALRELTEDLKGELFSRAPDPSITYAAQAHLWPITRPRAYGPLPAPAMARGTIGTSSYFGQFLGSITGVDTAQRYLTHGLVQAYRHQRAIAHLKRLDTGVTIRAKVTSSDSTYAGAGNTTPNAVHRVYLRPIAGGGSIPANGVQCEIVIRSLDETPASADVPILIDDVHIAQLSKDILLGKFGGTPYPIDAAAWDAVIADTSLPTVRFPITKTESRDAWLEQLLGAARIAIGIDGQGRAYPIDLRLTAAPEVLEVIDDTDLEGPQDGDPWQHDGDEAYVRIAVTLYDEEEIPGTALAQAEGTPIAFNSASDRATDAATIQISETPRPILFLDLSPKSFDLPGRKDLKIDARGWRTQPSERVAGGTGDERDDVIVSYARRLQNELSGPFGRGPQPLKLRCRRSVAAREGTFVELQVSHLVDPATCQRGGGRVALVTGREDRGTRAALDLVDYGSATTALPPAFTSAVLSASLPRAALDVTLALNAVGEAAELWVATTPTSEAVRPAVTDARWRLASTYRASELQEILVRRSGSRHWLRARTISDSARGLRRPSDWVYPAGSGYLDTTATPAPSNVSANGLVISWTIGEAALPLRLRWRPTAEVEWRTISVLLPAGSTQFDLTGHPPAATEIQVQVYHEETSPYIGESAPASVTFVTPGAVALSPPTNPQGESDQSGGYWLTVTPGTLPSSTEFEEAIETGVGSGVYNSYIQVAVQTSVSPTTTWSGFAPNDGLKRRLRARHVRGTDTPSAYTAPVDVLPWGLES